MHNASRVAIAACAAVAAAITPAARAGAAPAAPDPAPLLRATGSDVLPGSYIVVLKKGSRSTSRMSASTARTTELGGTVQRRFARALSGYSARLTAGQLTELRQDPAVAYVEPNQVVRADGIQTKPVWNLDRIDQAKLPMDGSYRYASVGSGVTAYVVDSGIFGSHVDFGGRVGGGVSEIGDTHGTNDCNGHGTHVAGTLGGHLFGVAKAVHLIPVRVLDCTGQGSLDQVIAGLDWVVGDHTSGPAVANLSLGGNPSQAVDDAVQSVIDDGVTVAVAAGNDGSTPSACGYSPARAPQALTVSATDKTDARPSWAHYGACLDFFAPGVDVVSDWNAADTVADLDGTSMASPHVAGAAALWLESHPSATPAEVRAALVAQASNGVVRNAGTGSANRLVFSLTRATPPATGPSRPDRVLLGETLHTGEKVCSANGLYCLTERGPSGGLTVYKVAGNRTLWSTGKAASWATVTNGRVTEFDGYGVAVSSFGSSGSVSGLQLVMQDDGNLVLYGGSAAFWASHTSQRIPPAQPTGSTDRLAAGQALWRGGVTLHSPNGAYRLILQAGDGNLVIYHGSTGIWGSGQFNDDWLSAQSDGNIVLYRSDGTAVWASGTGGQGAATLRLQDDGNLVLYRNSDGKALWASHSTGR